MQQTFAAHPWTFRRAMLHTTTAVVAGDISVISHTSDSRSDSSNVSDDSSRNSHIDDSSSIIINVSNDSSWNSGSDISVDSYASGNSNDGERQSQDVVVDDRRVLFPGILTKHAVLRKPSMLEWSRESHLRYYPKNFIKSTYLFLLSHHSLRSKAATSSEKDGCKIDLGTIPPEIILRIIWMSAPRRIPFILPPQIPLAVVRYLSTNIQFCD